MKVRTLHLDANAHIQARSIKCSEKGSDSMLELPH